MVIVLLFLLMCMSCSDERPELSLPIYDIEVSTQEYPYLFKTSYFDEWFSMEVRSDTLQFAGKLRLFGGLSRQAPKKSFKLVSEMTDESFILSSQYEDKSLCHYQLSNYLFQKAGFETGDLSYCIL